MDAVNFTNSKISGEIAMNNTKSLAEHARLGDEESFKLIFEQHHRIVLRFIYGMVRNFDLAEEVTQETFLSAHHSLVAYSEEGKLSAWLCGIARNVTRNWTRSHKHKVGNVELDEQNIHEAKNVSQSPADVLLEGELNDKVLDALQTLDEDKQTVFVLKTLRQFSYEEISQITGSTVPKLKTDLHRARIKMQRLIRPYLESDYEV